MPATRMFVAKSAKQFKSRRQEQHWQNAIGAGVSHVPENLLTDAIRSPFDGPRGLSNQEGQPYDDRIMRDMVSQKYIPLQAFLQKHPEHLETMARQMLQCLHDLHYKANILHRDVGVNSIVCEMRGDSPHFILVDFDHATVVTEPGGPTNTTSKQHTGNLPFMAWELVKDLGQDLSPGITHKLHHDFQSLFWTTMWCTSKVEPVLDDALRDRIDRAILDWEKGDFRDISSRKRDILTCRDHFADFPMTPSFEGNRTWLKKWRLVFSEAILEETRLENLNIRRGGIDEKVDDAVMDNLVSLERIAQTVGWKDLETESNASGFSSWLRWLLPSSLY